MAGWVFSPLCVLGPGQQSLGPFSFIRHIVQNGHCLPCKCLPPDDNLADVVQIQLAEFSVGRFMRCNCCRRCLVEINPCRAAIQDFI